MQNFLVKSASTIFQNVAFWNNFGHFPSPPHPPFPPPPPPKKKKKKVESLVTKYIFHLPF